MPIHPSTYDTLGLQDSSDTPFCFTSRNACTAKQVSQSWDPLVPCARQRVEKKKKDQSQGIAQDKDTFDSNHSFVTINMRSRGSIFNLRLSLLDINSHLTCIFMPSNPILEGRENYLLVYELQKLKKSNIMIQQIYIYIFLEHQNLYKKVLLTTGSLGSWTHAPERPARSDHPRTSGPACWWSWRSEEKGPRTSSLFIPVVAQMLFERDHYKRVLVWCAYATGPMLMHLVKLSSAWMCSYSSLTARPLSAVLWWAS